MAGTALPAFAQPPAPDAERAQRDADQKAAQLLSDFVHYILIARHDLAQVSARELLDMKLAPAKMVELFEQSGDLARVDAALQTASRVDEVQEVAQALLKAYEEGKLARARDPKEIERNIQALTGTMRGRLLARERLIAAGEYAIPQLLQTLLSPANPAASAEAQRVLIDMGRQSVIPLSTAMLKLPPAQAERVADVLGLITWRTSLPFLADAAQTSGSEAVRKAAARAIERLGGGGASTAELYHQLAETYYAEKPEVISFPKDPYQLLWAYEPATGLYFTPIRTPVYHEAMAMSLAERGMQLERGQGGVSPETLALWVASNFSREIDTPQGYANPAYPVAGEAKSADQARRPADYYGVAAGGDVAQRVLARALSTKDTPLARRALSVLERTAGARGLSANTNSPLTDALTYPDRRVQLDAALAIAAGRPSQAFAASDRVVPTLASSVRGGASQVAAVIGGSTESYQGTRRQLEKLGYSVLPHGSTLREVESPIAEAPAVDLVVLAGFNADRLPAQIAEVRGAPKLAAAPIMAVTSADAYIELRNRYDGTSGISVRQVGIGEDAMSKSIGDLVRMTSGGPITEAEARDYARRAITALRDLSIENNPVLNAGDAALPLIAAVGDAKHPMRLPVADLLARIGQDRAQRALMDAALAADGAERVALMNLTADSARRFGNLLESRHTSRLVEIAMSGNDTEATAAAALIGALQIPNTDLMPLIVRQ